MNNCYKQDDRKIELLIQQLTRETKQLMDTTTARLLAQDGKIASMCVYIKDNLSATLMQLLDTMKVSGELSDIITDIILADIMNDIEKTNVYYDGVTSEKLFDDTSKTYYYITKIPAKDKNGCPIKLKVGVANDNPMANTLESTLAFAARKNATVAINAGVYDVDTLMPLGTLIIDSKVLYEAMPTEDKYQFLGIKANGTIKTYSRGTTAAAMLRDGVTDAVCIFGSLLEKGVAVEQTDDRKDPRQSIGVDQYGNIIIVTCDGRTYESAGMTYADLARIHYSNGSYNAWILDGGGSASTVVRGIKQNENIDYNIIDRAINNFLYVAKDTNVTSDNNANNDIGKVKQFLNEKIENKLDFIKGYIRVRSPEKHYAPGIEFYVNAEASRCSKLGITYDAANARNTYLYWGLKAPGDTSEKTNLFRIYQQGVWFQTYHGPSSSRPNGIIGLCYFDETLGKPIWFNGSKWVDATGTEV